MGPGRAVTAQAFRSAVEVPDEPPMLVVLNACKSAAQLEALLGISARLVVPCPSNQAPLQAPLPRGQTGTYGAGQTCHGAHPWLRSTPR